MTSKEWKNYKFSELVYILGGGTPKTTVLEYWNGTIPWLSVKDFNSGEKFVYTTEKTITQLGLEKSSTQLLKKNDIILSARGTVGEIAVIPFLMAFNQSCYGIRAKEEIINSDFLYYLLKNSINLLKHNTHGSVFDTITRETFGNIEIKLPPLKTQQKIAKVLSAIDDKIELNNSINNNLEQQAQAIFKFWFIDNEYEIEKETTIGEICKCELGGTPSRNKKEYWKGSIAWINSGAVNNYRITKATEYITELGLSKSATKLLPKKTTVLAITGATLGQISLLEIDSCTNQSVVGILENEQVPYEFIYPYICHNIHELLSHQTGGAQQHINKQNIEQLAISFPKHDVICKYKKLVNPIYSKITNNCFENETLTQLRDTLLPKLMNGEIDVSKVDIDDILEKKSVR